VSPEHLAESRAEIDYIRSAADFWRMTDPELWRDLIDSCDLAAEALNKIERQEIETPSPIPRPMLQLQREAVPQSQEVQEASAGGCEIPEEEA
jgi:hypothetical protein